jgi:carboxyl-terminal processing protease
MLNALRRYALPGLLFLTVGVGVGMSLGSSTDDDTFAQLRKVQDAFVRITQEYVEDVDSSDLADETIVSMLDHLDPHSSYITAEEVAAVQDNYRGSFGGVGVVFEIISDTIHVVQTVADGPSDKVGLVAGDRIVGIDDSTAVGITNRDVQDRLKGPIGSQVAVTVQRLGMPEPLDFTIRRDQIPLYSVYGTHMIDDVTGYLRVTRFASTTPDEVMEAVQSLKQQGMERLVLDLRFNPGGVMQAAIRMVDEALGGGQVIVSQQGRKPEYNDTFRSTRRQGMGDMPIIVLVNGGSASASEIVSGALQDQDRALIVGQRTFGKGLVQRPFPLSDGSLVQITIARYYTPSGRLIQTEYEEGDREAYYEEKYASLEASLFNLNDYIESVPDSLKFQTSQGRTVFGGGGILPDYIVPVDTNIAPVMRAINRGGLYNLFVRDYFSRNEADLRATWADRREDYIAGFEPDDALLGAFWDFAETKDITLTTDPTAAAASEDLYLRSDAEANMPEIETYLKAALGRQLYGVDAWYVIATEVDNELEEAMKLWDRAERLAENHSLAGGR